MRFALTSVGAATNGYGGGVSVTGFSSTAVQTDNNIAVLDAFATNTEDAMDLTTQIDEANSRLEAFQKAGNAAGMGKMYTEDAVLLPAGATSARGREAIEAFWENMLGSGVENVLLSTDELVPLDQDLA